MIFFYSSYSILFLPLGTLKRDNSSKISLFITLKEHKLRVKTERLFLQPKGILCFCIFQICEIDKCHLDI